MSLNVSYHSWDPKKQKNQSRLFHTMYGYWDTGWNTSRVNELVKILTQGFEFSTCSQHGLKLLLLIQGAIKRSFPCLKCRRIVVPWGQRSNMHWRVCVTFDLMKLLDANTSDKVYLSLFDFLYKAEQFETIFIEIGACWDFDPLCKDFEKFFWSFTYFTLYLKNHTSYELTVIVFFVS